MKLNEKIIKLRKEEGLSQEEFGNEINVSRQAVSKWENDESKPDIDKIQEIVRKFNVTYEYLLDDDVENMERISEVTTKNKKHKGKIILKVFLLILLLYSLVCIYKFIVLYRFYLIANSFSEENYFMNLSFVHTSEHNAVVRTFWHTYKFGNKIELTSGVLSDEQDYENGKVNYDSYSIQFIDKNKKISYMLNYDNETDMYEYEDMKNNIDNEEEYYDKSENIIRETTLSAIPSSFKDIFLASIDPRIYVSIINREIRARSDEYIVKIKLNNDYLIEYYYVTSEYRGFHNLSSYNYNYVQNGLREIEDPLEKYKDKIIYGE